MPHTTLTVPAKYADDFRAALTHDLAEEAGHVKKARREYLEAVDRERYFPDKKADDSDWRSMLKMLDRDTELFRQAGFEQAGDIEICMEDDQGVVPFACETVARKVIGPQLMEALDCGPFDENYAAKLHELIEHLSWAINAAAEVNAQRGRKGEAV